MELRYQLSNLSAESGRSLSSELEDIFTSHFASLLFVNLSKHLHPLLDFLVHQSHEVFGYCKRINYLFLLLLL
jgi:hypothetical protein